MKLKTILFIAAFLFCSQIPLVGASQIIIQDADSTWNSTASYSEDLTNITSGVTPRIPVEYAKTIYHNILISSSDLLNATSSVTPRIVVEYANSNYRKDLDEIPTDLANLTEEVLPKIIIEYANSNYYEKLIFPKELINDTTSPVITNVTATDMTDDSATIKWNTDEITDSLVKYGKASRIYTESEEDSLFVKSHTIELTGLLPSTFYYFVVNSSDQSGNSAESSEYSFTTSGVLKEFDTRAPANPYPSIFGTHNGTIKPNQTITVSMLYTYPCVGTGGHSEYMKIWNNSADWNVTARWEGYSGDWHNISFDNPFTLEEGETYNYTICTGSYPQIHHTDNLSTSSGFITCTEFIDANGKRYKDWIPAIRLE